MRVSASGRVNEQRVPGATTMSRCAPIWFPRVLSWEDMESRIVTVIGLLDGRVRFVAKGAAFLAGALAPADAADVDPAQAPKPIRSSMEKARGVVMRGAYARAAARCYRVVVARHPRRPEAGVRTGGLNP